MWDSLFRGSVYVCIINNSIPAAIPGYKPPGEQFLMPRETDLYAPVKEYLLNQGFTVRGEVRDCDLAAVKNGELLVVELKVAFNLDLVIQGNERKRICDNVYLAIPQPKNLHSPHW
ncbi:MAG TPA: hypothetical protein PKV05_09165, partial [Bacillota bacterium]|nr:hypothetical protein [Bacillota bacterium]